MVWLRRQWRIPDRRQPRTFLRGSPAATHLPQGLRAHGGCSTGRPKRIDAMKRSNLSLTLRALAMVIVAGFAGPALAGQSLPFKGNLEGLHVSRTPLDPTRFFDVFEATGQATHLGQFELVIEAVVNFGTRP